MTRKKTPTTAAKPSATPGPEVPVTPIEGLDLPYWGGLWLGLYPTWEGLIAQAAALAFVLGSYVAAEAVRNRRRARILAAPIGAQRVDA